MVSVASFGGSAANTVNNHEIRAELYIDGINAKAHYEELEKSRTQIEKDLNKELTWYSTSNVRACRIYTRKPIDLKDTSRWSEYIDWLVKELNDFYRYFSPIIRNLDP